MQVLARPRPQPAARPGDLRRLLAALGRLRRGDTAVRLPGDWPGLHGELAGAVNELAVHLAAQARSALRSEDVARQNREVEQARQALEDKAEQLALASKYKSEFLANMSHELRTPLNSLLILSDQLSKNAEGNLSQRQVEFARTIHASGHDLLMLINDILDLSKIESGTVAVDIGPLRLGDLQRFVERTFGHVAEARQLAFTVDCALRPATTVRTDAMRLQQILKNLLSNAFKFTHRGGVRLTIEPAHEGWSPQHPQLRRARRVLAFTVSDTGIGICPDKQQIIFEAFQQADGSTSRHYGGTGLGLTISRELARLLGGEIRLSSVPGEGSTFTLFLPLHPPAQRATRHGGTLAEAWPVARRRRVPAPRAVAASVLAVAPAADAPACTPAPAAGPVIDLRPVPGEAPVLLVVDAEGARLRALREAAWRSGWQLQVARSGAEALLRASQAPPAALVLAPQLPDMPCGRLLRRLRHDPALSRLPACVLGPSPGPAGRLDDRLREVAHLQGPPRPAAPATSLAGLRALVVDDDMRNIFALATVLEEHGMDIVWADNGHQAVERVARDRRIAVALLDIMMPAFDGLATLREIRRLPHGRALPVIAVTARAMKGDREKCIAAGAWDYLAKPVNTPDLLAVLRAWLPPA